MSTVRRQARLQQELPDVLQLLLRHRCISSQQGLLCSLLCTSRACHNFIHAHQAGRAAVACGRSLTSCCGRSSSNAAATGGTISADNDSDSCSDSDDDAGEDGSQPADGSPMQVDGNSTAKQLAGNSSSSSGRRASEAAATELSRWLPKHGCLMRSLDLQLKTVAAPARPAAGRGCCRCCCGDCGTCYDSHHGSSPAFSGIMVCPQQEAAVAAGLQQAASAPGSSSTQWPGLLLCSFSCLPASHSVLQALPVAQLTSISLTWDDLAADHSSNSAPAVAATLAAATALQAATFACRPAGRPGFLPQTLEALLPAASHWQRLHRLSIDRVADSKSLKGLPASLSHLSVTFSKPPITLVNLAHLKGLQSLSMLLSQPSPTGEDLEPPGDNSSHQQQPASNKAAPCLLQQGTVLPARLTSLTVEGCSSEPRLGRLRLLRKLHIRACSLAAPQLAALGSRHRQLQRLELSYATCSQAAAAWHQLTVAAAAGSAASLQLLQVDSCVMALQWDGRWQQQQEAAPTESTDDEDQEPEAVMAAELLPAASGAAAAGIAGRAGGGKDADKENVAPTETGRPTAKLPQQGQGLLQRIHASMQTRPQPLSAQQPQPRKGQPGLLRAASVPARDGAALHGSASAAGPAAQYAEPVLPKLLRQASGAGAKAVAGLRGQQASTGTGAAAAQQQVRGSSAPTQRGAAAAAPPGTGSSQQQQLEQLRLQQQVGGVQVCCNVNGSDLDSLLRACQASCMHRMSSGSGCKVACGRGIAVFADADRDSPTEKEKRFRAAGALVLHRRELLQWAACFARPPAADAAADAAAYQWMLEQRMRHAASIESVEVRSAAQLHLQQHIRLASAALAYGADAAAAARAAVVAPAAAPAAAAGAALQPAAQLGTQLVRQQPPAAAACWHGNAGYQQPGYGYQQPGLGYGRQRYGGGGHSGHGGYASQQQQYQQGPTGFGASGYRNRRW